MNAEMLAQVKRSKKAAERQVMMNQIQLAPRERSRFKKVLMQGMDFAKNVVFENISLEEKSTLKRKAKKVSNAYKASLEARQARDIFEALYLTEKDVTKFYNIFSKICILVDPIIDDRISYSDFLQFLDLDHCGFHSRFYHNYDTGHRNQIDFKSFVVATWTYCTLSEGSLVTFCFDLYDVHSAGMVYEDDLITLVKDVFGPNYKNDPKACKVLEKMDRMCQPTVGGYAISIDMFLDFTKHHAPSLLMPAYEMQRRMRERIMGNAFWDKVSKMEVAKTGAFRNNGINREFLDVDILMRAHIDEQFAVRISEDPYLRTQTKVTNIMTVSGSKIKRHEDHVKAAKQLRAANRWRRLSRALLNEPPKVGGKGGRQIKVAPELDKYKIYKAKNMKTFMDTGMTAREKGQLRRTFHIMGLRRWEPDYTVIRVRQQSGGQSTGKLLHRTVSFEDVESVARPRTAGQSSSKKENTQLQRPHTTATARLNRKWNGKRRVTLSPISNPDNHTTAPSMITANSKKKPPKAMASGWIPTNNRPLTSVKLGTVRPQTANSTLKPYLTKPSPWTRPVTPPSADSRRRKVAVDAPIS